MLSHFFIDRPIFSVVIALVISIAGLVAMVNLPIAQFPQITPIQIQVTATYPGANGTLLAQNVGAPIEQKVNGANIGELAELLWDGGYAPYSTVLQAQEQLFPQELALTGTRARLLGSSVDIYRATGGGWVNEADKRAPQPVAP